MRCLLTKFFLVSVLIFIFPIAVFAEQPIKIKYTVICENNVVQQKITNAIGIEFKKYKDIVISDKLPLAELFLLARQDSNDRINKEGWSFAIAHVSNNQTQVLALKLINSKSEEIQTLRPNLADLLKEAGFLQHLNVAHIDKMTNENLQIVVEYVVENFLKKITE